jgi:hypothetical protein
MFDELEQSLAAEYADDLNFVMKVNDVEARARTSRVLCQGTTYTEADLTEEDKRPVEDLVKIVKHTDRDLIERVSAVSKLKDFGLFGDSKRPDPRRSPLGLLGYIRVQNLRMRNVRRPVLRDTKADQSQQHEVADDEEEDPALRHFDCYIELNTGGQSYSDLKCSENCLETDRDVEADGIKEGFEKALTTFYRSAAAGSGEDAERIANRAKALTIWHLPGSEDTVYDPVDIYYLLQESIKASRKSDQFSNNSQTLGTSGS